MSQWSGGVVTNTQRPCDIVVTIAKYHIAYAAGVRKQTHPMGIAAHGAITFHDIYGATTMTVRAKVRCNAKTENEVHFCTVYEQPDERDTENMRFTEASPWGDIRLGIDNPAALEQFKVNREYYVDFNPVTQNDSGLHEL